MRVFLDTNVLVSAVATRGLCADVLREILVSHQLAVSAPLIAEIEKILSTKIGVPQEAISDFVDLLTQDCIWSEMAQLVEIDIKDKDDIVILSTALAAKTEIFVTGDKELLELEIIQSMRIRSPRSFWESLKSQSLEES